MRLIFCTLVVASTLAGAQTAQEPTNKRMVLQSAQQVSSPDPATPTATPLSLNSPVLFPKATPTPSATPALAQGPLRPADATDAISNFFTAISAGKIDEAYDELVKNSIIADRKDDLANLKAQTRQAIDKFGPISGFEPVEMVEIASRLRRHVCISLNEDLPLRWKFYFYKNRSDWRLVDIRIDDGLAELFDDVARNRRK